jgi:hypothetical protein
MDLWQLFVLSQVRLSGHMDYDQVHFEANNNRLIRQLMGLEVDPFCGFRAEIVEFSRQTIVDNVSLLDDETMQQINSIIVSFGHGEVFKKKETEALHCKTDSFVVESNVHFPTDYNLLWDCIRKCLDMIIKFEIKYGKLSGWRKLSNWRSELKAAMRAVGQASKSGGKNKEEKLKNAATAYIHKSKLFSLKVSETLPKLPIMDVSDLSVLLMLEHYFRLLNKHINLVDRRIMKGESIPQEEKMFSIFEPYTEWIVKGKQRPRVELGKKLAITTDQFQLIIDYGIMNYQSDSEILIALADRLTSQFNITSWSFDKGYWHPDNRALLELVVSEVIMPKKGKCNHEEFEREHSNKFIKYRNLHSAVESNIHSLETRGLSRCPDRSEAHFNRYIGWGVCAYNLCCIGRKLMADYWIEQARLKRAA